MRLLVLIQSLPPNFIGGHEIRCRNFSRYLVDRGHQVVVMTGFLHQDGPSEKDPFFYCLQTQYSFRHKPHPLGWIKIYKYNIKQFNMMFRSFNPELICIWNSHLFGMNFLRYVSAQKKVPVVWYFGGDGSAKYTDPLDHFLFGQSKSLIKNVVKEAILRAMPGLKKRKATISHDWAVFPSRHLQRRWRDIGGGQVKKYCVIEPGVSVENMPVRTTDNYEAIPRFLFLGRCDTNKDPLSFLHAIKILNENNINVSATLVFGSGGDEKYKEKIHKLASDIGQSISVLYEVSNEKIPEILSQHEVIVFISKHEGFGVALVEAMTCGLAPIVTACGGVTEHLEEGRECLRVQYGNSEQLSERMRELLENPDVAAKIGCAASNLARKRFSFDRFLDEVEAFHKEVIRGHSYERSA